MSTLADVHAAEDLMINAQKALHAHADNHNKDLDTEGFLVAELRKATDDYLNTVIALGSK